MCGMNELLEKLQGFQSRLLLAIHGIPNADLRRVEADGKWSIFGVIAHLGDLELVTGVRIRTALATPGAPLPALAQEEWVARVHRESLAEVLEAFWFHRRHNLQLLRSLGDEEWSLAGVHPEYGPRTILELMTKIEAHEEKHLQQIERIKSTLGLTASDQPDVSGVTFGRINGKMSSPGEGVRVHELWSDGLRRALEVVFDPGAQWPGLDYHVPGPEAVYVLRGDFDDGANVHHTGAFLHHPAGSSHSPRSTDGCALFVYYPEG